MCLGIPGKVTTIFENNSLKMGKVNFSGIIKEICLAYVPEAKQNDYVIVHAGFAISIIDEKEAREIFNHLEQITQTNEIFN